MAGEVWQVKIDGQVYEADTDTLIQWAAGGYIQPRDKVKKGSLDWTDAQHVPILRAPLQQFQMNPPQQPQGYANPGFQNQGYASSGNPGDYQMGGQGWYAGGQEKPKTGLAAFMARFETPIFSGYVLWLTAICVVTLALTPLVWLVAGARAASIFCLAIGGSVSVIGSLAFLLTAFSVSFIWGLGCLCIPVVNLIFLFLNWDAAKRPFFVTIIGYAMIIIAAFVMAIGERSAQESRFIPRDGVISVARAGAEPAMVLSLPVRLS